MCIAIVGLPGFDVMNFEMNLIFLIKPFSRWPKSHDDNLNILGTKELLRQNKNHFLSSLKGFQLSK